MIIKVGDVIGDWMAVTYNNRNMFLVKVKGEKLGSMLPDILEMNENQTANVSPGFVQMVLAKPVSTKLVQSQPQENVPKPDKVRFYRYIRPVNKNGVIDNMQGATFYFVVDYKAKVVWFSVSMTKNENFSKSVGRHFAKERFAEGLVVSWKMDSRGIHPDGIVQEAIWRLSITAEKNGGVTQHGGVTQLWTDIIKMAEKSGYYSVRTGVPT